MTSKGFVRLTLALAAGVSLLIVLINWKINFYGLFGDMRHQQRSPITNERASKLLFGYNYIPSNFDALMIGSSESDNLDPTKFRGYRMYNIAVGGATMTEDKLIIENALNHGDFKLMVFGLSTFLFKSHGLRDGVGMGLNTRDYFSTLGSVTVLRDYMDAYSLWHDHGTPMFTPEGRVNYEIMLPAEDANARLEAFLKKPAVNGRYYVVDEIAYQELSELLATARARHIRVAVFFPPAFGPRFRALRADYDEVKVRGTALFRPEELLADFNDPRYADFTENKANFWDGVHLTNAATEPIVKVLDEALNGPLPAAPGAVIDAAAGPGR